VAIVAAGAGAVALLAAIPGPAAIVICVVIVAGCVRGVFTLLQATAISDRWGTRQFATLNGVFSAPTTSAMALAPAGGALFAELMGGYPAAFWLLAALVFTGALTAIGTRAQDGLHG
jgi:hypothetical protein